MKNRQLKPSVIRILVVACLLGMCISIFAIALKSVTLIIISILLFAPGIIIFTNDSKEGGMQQ